ncbi:sigma-54-dependent transcriptional regulator [Desulfomonile tiedjei]|uniref:Response regulator with CheY-like receiver, AAA-type ATPase, and DNA-binding domains n=1 Tax=Desulfomonile tiedjei (strain ATCC 49306 / DSM 6799 / DCB-1) TaxID=706587 RepID=I4CDA8_DESTA|nr:sigma-54 dependent transcriptional regulator [Desulfomonile tiedjei]AFM27549.1 response regulator with CheY-like receiver, AAA-type ATPase, and DNA-binding domains [Desulfomonile tiedjei DSM 6799]
MSTGQARILIVDDEKDFCEILFHVVRREGFAPLIAHNGETALEMVRVGMPDALLLDVKMPGMDGMEVLRRSKAIDPDLPVLMLTAYGGVNGAVQAMKEGAFDYLAKPLNNNELIEKLKRALENRSPRPKKPVAGSKAWSSTKVSLQEIMGPSDAVQKIISDIKLVAASNFTVVIQGETGSGKELVARAIHKASLRQETPLVSLDCGAIPETLFESELFGYEKGAFTGAISRRQGKFELAQGGTLFLDEITNMPVSCQTKLLRAIQERSFFRVGGSEPVSVDIRLLVATNQDLNIAVSQGRFSRDLLYRLSEFNVFIPPLRERKEDILHLSNRFIKATNTELNKKVKGLSDAALQILFEQKWPGNVRQLRATVRRAVLQAEDLIGPEHLIIDGSPPVCANIACSAANAWDGLTLKEIIRKSSEDLERRVLAWMLAKTKGNKAEAARLLQIDYKTIHSKLKQYCIKYHPEEQYGQKE